MPSFFTATVKIVLEKIDVKNINRINYQMSNIIDNIFYLSLISVE